MWNIVHRQSLLEISRYLNGNVDSSINLDEGADVDGETIIIDVGAGNVTITFAPVKGRDWTLDEIVAQINSSISGIASIYIKSTGNFLGRVRDRRLTLAYDPALTVRSGGTANSNLGFSTVTDTVQNLKTMNSIPFLSFLSQTNGQKEWTAVNGEGSSISSPADVNLEEVGGDAVHKPVAGVQGVSVSHLAGESISQTSGIQNVAVTSAPETEVDLTKVAGTATVEGGRSGSVGVGGHTSSGQPALNQPVEVGGAAPSGNLITSLLDAAGRSQAVGTQAADTAADDTTWPVKVGLKIRHTLSTITDQYINHLIGDDYGRLWVRDSAYDTTNSAEQIVGTKASGDPATGKPVEIGGVDGVGNLRTLLVGTGGRPQNDIDRIGGSDVLSGGSAGSLGVGGIDADGGTISANPNLIALKDSSDNTLQKVAMGDSDGRLELASHITATKSDSVTESDPVSLHCDDEATLISDTNQDTVTTRNILDMYGYQSFSIDWTLTGGVTLSIWATNDPDADATADTGWFNISPNIIGTQSTTDTTDMVIVDKLTVSKLMVKRETSDATNATDVHYKRGQ